MKTTAYHRPTRFAIHEVKQHHDGLELTCSARDVEPTVGANGQLEAPLVPLLKIADDALTPKQWGTLIEAFTILEDAAAAVYDGWVASPARNRELVVSAIEAEAKLAAAKKEAAKVAAEIEAKRAEASALDKAIAEKRAAKLAERVGVAEKE